MKKQYMPPTAEIYRLCNTCQQNFSWVDANVRLPTVEGDYLVHICGAELPTMLYFDTFFECWYDEEFNCYKITHWLEFTEYPW